jgi:hypothetical protein
MLSHDVDPGHVLIMSYVQVHHASLHVWQVEPLTRLLICYEIVLGKEFMFHGILVATHLEDSMTPA